MTPEQKARQQIDRQLEQCGWVVQSYRDMNISAGLGVAVREFPLTSGFADYLLYADCRAVGVLEAKPEGHTLTGVETQSGKYLEGLPKGLPNYRLPLPFAYESTGEETHFTNALEPDARSRVVFTFHRPDELIRLVELDRPVRELLRQMPPLDTQRLWRVQVGSIQNLEASLAANRPRSLIQMATGSGKTYTAVSFSYRLIKFAKVKRILFLVDRNNLGKQTLNEFQQYISPYTNRKFTEEYTVQHLKRNAIDPASKVCITTIQRLYSMLKGEEDFLEENEESSLFETESSLIKEALPVVYNPNIPIDSFDVIVVDECHRSIYNIWRQVLDYFDAFLIGLTATPTMQTIGFFNGNLVQDYTHEQAVADGVNVGYDVYRIETKITRDGAKLVREPGVFVPHRDRRTKSKKYKELDDDLAYTATQLDRDVVAENQIRLVIRTFRDKLPEIFPGRREVPKTLVFAKTDLHAEDIVRIIREEFGKGNDFCQKITSKTTGKKPEDLLSEFRNSYNPRIAVTVDMIATGTDVKPLECLLFMRNIRSLGYFEQMKGRGCRVIDPDALQMVTPDAKRKTHFVIVDAVGVCENEKTATKPLDRKPSVDLKKIMALVGDGAADADLVSTLAARLARLDRQLSATQKDALAKEAGGKDLVSLCTTLLHSIDADAIVEAASRRFDPTRQDAASTIGFFDPMEPIANLQGNLPHFRQPGVTYFVTFRCADSLPQAKLTLWLQERNEWLKRHPEPHSPEAKKEYIRLFTDRFHRWLDAGFGECLLSRPEIRQFVVDALNHFQGDRYHLLDWVVMPNHVHALVTPLGEHELSDILHSWKSFTAKQINRLLGRTSAFWQKESFDHIVRSAESLERFREYLSANPTNLREGTFALSPGLDTRRDAASTWVPTEEQLQRVEQEQMREALKPFHNPKLRNAILAARDSFQVIDESTGDHLLRAGFDASALEKARTMLTSFRQFIEDHKDEIEALKVLYSRPYRAGLRYGQVKELAAAIQKPPHQLNPERLWQAFELVDAASRRVNSASDNPETSEVYAAGRRVYVPKLVDVIALVKHALDPDTPLTPVVSTVEERYQQWLADQEKAGAKFTPEQRRWLDAIKDHIANSLSIEQDDFDGVPFSQIGGLGRAYELFGDKLAGILEDLNASLAA